jgi:hypothetical protein
MEQRGGADSKIEYENYRNCMKIEQLKITEIV